MLEKDIEKYLTKKVQEAGYLCFKFLSTVSGVPDRIIFGGGRCYLVELKNGKNGVLSAIQKYTFKQFKDKGFSVEIVRSLDDADSFVAKLPRLKGD